MARYLGKVGRATVTVTGMLIWPLLLGQVGGPQAGRYVEQESESGANYRAIMQSKVVGI